MVKCELHQLVHLLLVYFFRRRCARVVRGIDRLIGQSHHAISQERNLIACVVIGAIGHLVCWNGTCMVSSGIKVTKFSVRITAA